MVARRDRATDASVLAALLLARRGQSYFSRKLNELADASLSDPAILPGWTRAHVVAHVGLNARALTRLVEWAETGVPTPMYASPDQRESDIELAATLPAQALRNLSDHAAIHLNVAWRDLPDDAWENVVRTAQGRSVPVSETVWMRTREVWIHAVDLDNGASFDEFPPALIDGLITDVLDSWSRRRQAENIPDFTLAATDGDERWGAAVTATPRAEGPVVLSGTAAALARWATGRGSAGLTRADGGLVPPARRWL